MSDADQDQLLAGFLEQFIERSRDGETPDFDQFAREHPELSAELRELWATAMVVEDLARFSSDALAPTLVPPADADAGGMAGHADGQLPRPFGDYELLEEIGRGGMGVVFRARQKSLDRIVAVKMILRGALASTADLARFRSEAESAARLNHPHIVPVYEVGQVSGQPYFSMNLVEGTTLAKRLAEGPLSPREAAELLAPIAAAIAEAHQQGVLHRDLKPSNILIDEEGRPYVTDFGLAKRVPIDSMVAAEPDSRSPGMEPDSQSSALQKRPRPTAPLPSVTEVGAILGTPGYMAPEQAAGRRGTVTTATDIYSLGAILYAMLTGRAPFQAASPIDAVLMVLEQDPPSPRVLNQRVDPDLEMIALKCLQKPAELRYASASELAADLNAYLAGEPISARSSRFNEVFTRAFRETHHAGVLENWGLLWMWHSLVLVVLCALTNWFHWQQATLRWPVQPPVGASRWPYLALWTIGLGVWAGIFWSLRRRAGPVTFVERQIAHVWAGSVISSTGLFFIEWILGLPVLALSPVLGLISGMVFLAKGGILSGAFYIQALVLFATAAVMAWMQSISRATGISDFSITVFGIVSAVCFFFPGLKYYRQRIRNTHEG